MQLHQLRSKNKSKNIKRIGRGGKRGTYSGRGLKGQKSRSGRRIKSATKQTIVHLPKLKGIKFRSLKTPTKIIKLRVLSDKIKGGVINKKVLMEAKLITKKDKNIKILSEGKIEKVFEISGIKVSEKAKEKIEKAGGKVL